MDEPDLFAGLPPLKSATRSRREQPIELRNAHALCRRLKRTPARQEKKHIVHLICANIIALYKRSPRGFA